MSDDTSAARAEPETHDKATHDAYLAEAMAQRDERMRDAGLMPEQTPDGLPWLPVPHILGKTRDPRRPSEHQAGVKWTNEWTAHPVASFTDEALRTLRDVAANPAALVEIRFVAPRASEAVAARAEDIGGEEALAYQAATKGLEAARAGLDRRIAAIDAAERARDEAVAALEVAESGYGEGEVQWAEVDRRWSPSGRPRRSSGPRTGPSPPPRAPWWTRAPRSAAPSMPSPSRPSRRRASTPRSSSR